MDMNTKAGMLRAYRVIEKLIDRHGQWVVVFQKVTVASYECHGIEEVTEVAEKWRIALGGNPKIAIEFIPFPVRIP